jgi:hypothetical protein
LAGAFLAITFFAGADFFELTVFLDTDFEDAAFLGAVDFFAAGFFAVDFFATGFFAADFFAGFFATMLTPFPFSTKDFS